MSIPSYIKAGLMVPTYYESHISDLILYRIATDEGYYTVRDPPDWNKVWEDEKSILRDFGLGL
jgi:hypothetical protein